MVYEKAVAEIVLFDNSDVITASNCPGNSNNKGNGQGGGNFCTTSPNNKQMCTHQNSDLSAQPADMWNADWLA